MSEPDYFAVRNFRKEVPQKFREFPLVSDRDGWIARRVVKQARKVLEVGAGDRPFLPELLARGYCGEFKTMDVNPGRKFDYYSVDEISESFDAILLREVVEHCPRPQFYGYLEKFAQILAPGGLLILTTPNPWAVSWVFSDYTHVSPWPPADLYGVLRCFGFQPIEILRVVWPSRFLFLKRMYRAIHSRFYNVDFAGSYIAVAKNPADRQKCSMALMSAAEDAPQSPRSFGE